LEKREVKLTRFERRMILKAAKRIEEIFKLMGWRWKRNKRWVDVTFRRAAKVIRTQVRLLKWSEEDKDDDYYISGGGSGRVYVQADWEFAEEKKLITIRVFVEVLSIPIEYQDLFSNAFKHRVLTRE